MASHNLTHNYKNPTCTRQHHDTHDSSHGLKENGGNHETGMVQFKAQGIRKSRINNPTNNNGGSTSRVHPHRYALSSSVTMTLPSSLPATPLPNGNQISSTGSGSKTNNHRNSPSANSSASKTGKGTRRRIAIACGRCRKRKIRCSGESGQGIPCSNCKSAGSDNCEFLRVASQRATMKSELVATLDFDSLSSTRNSLSCGVSISPYNFQHIMPLDTTNSAVASNFAPCRNNLISPYHMRPMAVYNMGPAYDLSEQSTDYTIHASPPTYTTALPADHHMQAANYPSTSHLRNWNPAFTSHYTRSPPSFPDLTGLSLSTNTYQQADHHAPNTLPSSGSYAISQRCSFENRNFPFQSFSPLPSSPSSCLALTTNTTTGSTNFVEDGRQLPLPLMSRPTPSFLRSNDAYSISTSNDDPIDPEYPYESSFRAQTVSSLAASESENDSNTGVVLDHTYLPNNDDVTAGVAASLPSTHLQYNSVHEFSIDHQHHQSDGHQTHSNETNLYSADPSDASFSPDQTIDTSNIDYDDDHYNISPPLESNNQRESDALSCLESSHHSFLSMSDHIEKYSSSSDGFSNLAQCSTGYPTPVSIQNTFSPPP